MESFSPSVDEGVSEEDETSEDSEVVLPSELSAEPASMLSEGGISGGLSDASKGEIWSGRNYFF